MTSRPRAGRFCKDVPKIAGPQGRYATRRKREFLSTGATLLQMRVCAPDRSGYFVQIGCKKIPG